MPNTRILLNKSLIRVLFCDGGTAQDAGHACSMPFGTRVNECQGIHFRHPFSDCRPASSFERASLTLQIQQIKQHNHMSAVISKCIHTTPIDSTTHLLG